MTQSIFEGTMNSVFDQIEDEKLIDDMGLLLLLRSHLGQRNASEICNMTEDQLRMELWFLTDDDIGDHTTEQAAKILKTALLCLGNGGYAGGASDSSGRFLHEMAARGHKASVEEPMDDNMFCHSQLMNAPSFGDWDTTSGDIEVSGRNVGLAYSVSGDIRIRNALVQRVSTVSGDIKLENAILLTSCETTSGNIKGHFYLAPGALVTTVSGDIKAKYERLSWRELYDKANEMGIAAGKNVGDLRPSARANAPRETITICQSHPDIDYFILNDAFAVCNRCGIANATAEFERLHACPNCGK